MLQTAYQAGTTIGTVLAQHTAPPGGEDYLRAATEGSSVSMGLAWGPIVILGGLLVLALLAFFVLAVFRLLFGGASRQDNQAAEAEESRMMQEIHAGLVRLEERVESLEAILFDHSQARGRQEIRR